jgi:protein-S-isoprenylcysteine O-methyltransferase Ste14
MAVAVWLVYVCFHLILVPSCFALRYRRSPFVWRWLPQNGYDIGEWAYGLLVIGYTLAIMFGPPIESHLTVFALAFVIGGSALILWAVATLGSHWRIGQDEGDRACLYVSGGPYRFVRHPVYWGMAAAAFGQMLLTNGDIRGLILFAGTVSYVLLQSRAESRRWRNQQINAS